MRRYTTPTIPLKVKGIDISGASGVFVTIRQRSRTIEVEATDVTFDGTDTNLNVELTQRQTASLQSGQTEDAEGDALIQVNWTYLVGGEVKRDATKAKRVPVLVNLMERVIDA